jgi:hypothetical protein
VRGLAFTDRDQAIVREIARFGVMSRDQLTRLRFFSSKTRANERLKRLVDEGYIGSRRQPIPVGGPRFVYVPGRLSSDARDARKRIAEMSGLFLAHQLGLVDIRIAFEQHTTLARWLSEKDLTGLCLGLVPDAYLEYEVHALTYCAFIEYDRGTETLGRIERKVRAYLDLAHPGRFERTFKRKPVDGPDDRGDLPGRRGACAARARLARRAPGTGRRRRSKRRRSATL